jgi:hypothetical protein
MIVRRTCTISHCLKIVRLISANRASDDSTVLSNVREECALNCASGRNIIALRYT